MADSNAQRVLFRALSELGWVRAGVNNPVMVKNDYLFVFHTNDGIDLTPKISFRSDNKIGNSRPVLIKVSGCSWHVERFGWLIDKGRTPSLIGNFSDYEGSLLGLDTALDELLDRIDSLAKKSDIAIKSKKQRLVTVKSKGAEKEIVPSSRPLNNGSYFLGVDPIVQKYGMNTETIYCLNHFDSTGFYIGIMNDNLTGTVDGRKVVVSVDDFMFLAKSNYLMTVDVVHRSVDTHEQVWRGVAQASSVDFPEELGCFNIAKNKQPCVAQAFSEGINVTPFLRNISISTMNALLEAGRGGVDVGIFARHELNDAVILELLGLLQEGYYVDSLLSAGYSAEYVKAIFEESFADMKIKEGMLSNEGYSADQVKALLQLGFDGINTSKYENKKYSAECIHMLYYGDQHPEFMPLVDLFTSRAFEGAKLYVPADYLGAEEKACIRRIFNTEDLKIAGRTWNDFVEEVLSGLHYVFFARESGFLLKAADVGLGCSYNSYFVTDLTEKPRWRANYINEKFYVNHNCESSLFA